MLFLKGEVRVEIYKFVGCKLGGWGIDRGDLVRMDNNMFCSRNCVMVWRLFIGLGIRVVLDS